MSQNKLVFFATDMAGWCFDNIARKLTTLLCDEFRFQVAPHIQFAKGECDVLVNLWWGSTLRLRANVKSKAVVTCVYDHLSWSVNPESRHQFSLVLMNTDLLVVSNQILAKEINETYQTWKTPLAIPEMIVAEDGVDTALFTPKAFPTEFTAGWTGNSQRDTPGGPVDMKGRKLIEQACKLARVPLNILDVATCGGAWPHTEMPKFYKDLSVYICASYCEGTPNPVLEAMACGKPVISTAVGITPELIQEGSNGFLVDRTVGAIAAALSNLKIMRADELARMGKLARSSVATRHDWKVKAETWRLALRRAELAAEYKRATKNTVASFAASSLRKQELVPVQRIEPITATIKTGDEHNNKTIKVLYISDIPGWAFHRGACGLAKYLSSDFKLDHWHVIDYLNKGFTPNLLQYNVIYAPYHRWGIMDLLPYDRTLGSLRSRWFVQERPGAPSLIDIKLVNKFRAFNVVAKTNFEELAAYCPNVVLLTNPVDHTRFSQTHYDYPVASWCGNGRHNNNSGVDVKGFWPIIVPACQDAKVPLEYAEYHTKKLTQEEMPAFYQKGNIALCASLYEGASGMCMESMCAGHALITTDCGNIRDIQESQLAHFNDTGIIIIPRSRAAFAEMLEKLSKDLGRIKAMGEMNREEIISRWSWDYWIKPYTSFLKRGIAKT